MSQDARSSQLCFRSRLSFGFVLGLIWSLGATSTRSALAEPSEPNEAKAESVPSGSPTESTSSDSETRSDEGAPAASSEPATSASAPSEPTSPSPVAPSADESSAPSTSDAAKSEPAPAQEPAKPAMTATTEAATTAEAGPPAEAAPPTVPATPATSEPAPQEAAEPDEPIEIVVAGSSLKKLAGSAQVIGVRQLERFEYDDAAAILQQVPGVYVRQEDGVGLRPNLAMRGVNPDRSKKLTLMEDGVLFGPAPYSAPAAYFFPLLTRMVQVRAIKGPGAIAYGPQTTGGAIDLITRSAGDGTHGGLDIGFGQYLYQKEHAYFTHADGPVSFVLEGVRLGTTGFKELPGGGDTGFIRNEWMAKLGYQLDPLTQHHHLSVKASYDDEASNETYLGLTDADFRENPLARYEASRLDRMENHRTSLVLGYTYEGHGTTRPKLTVQLYRHDFDRTWRKFNALAGAAGAAVIADPTNPSNIGFYDVLRGTADSLLPGESILIGPNHRTFASQGLQTVVTIHPETGPLKHSIEGGLRLHNDSIRRHHSQNSFVMQGGSLFPEDKATQVTTVNKDETNALAFHLLDAIEWGPLLVTPGVRLELIQARSDDYLKNTSKSDVYLAAMPGVSAHYGITSDFGLLVGAYRGFSPSAPGTGAAPESSINYEGGARYQGKDLRAELIGFYNDYSNLTDVCSLASGCVNDDLDRQFSAGAARVYGLETYLKAEPHLGEWSFPGTLAYTLSSGEFLSNFESADPIYGSVSAGDHLPYIPTHQGNVTVGAESKHFGASAAVTYVSRMREIASQLPYEEVMSTDEQIWADFGAYYRPLAWLEVYANLRNAFDGHFIVSRRPYGARPNAPRWFQVGIKAKF
jgi:Fe(3+) dicitrate transport protein